MVIVSVLINCCNGTDYAKICKGGDCGLGTRFFGNAIGKSKTYRKSGNSIVTASEEECKRQLCRDKYKIVRCYLVCFCCFV